MSKILAATCEAGVVKVGDLSVPSAVVQSSGVASSDGVLLMEGDTAFYLSKTSEDLMTSIEKTSMALEDLASALNTIATTFTSIGAGMTGASTTPPPTLAVDVASIISKATELTALKTELNTLKGNLR